MTHALYSITPATLHGVNGAIELLLRKGYIGKETQEQLPEQPELNNFETTLRFLVQQNAECKQLVKITKATSD